MNKNLAAKVDFSKLTGKINPKQHGSNSCPVLSTRGLLPFDREHRAMHLWGARTHDWPLWNQGQRMIDTHFVFPLFKQDPADPTNYYFQSTDAIIENCINAGSKIFYRLGTSIEHSGERHFNTFMPDDFDKYAEILAGIVRHYTQGWADGFHYDMEYWEIWNEPDLGDRMWSGTLDEFISFFVTVLKRLKSEFPQLKVGGPGLCWLDSEFFKKLLSACKEAGVAPDFISWHYYGNQADELIGQPRKARELLDSLGFTKTETCINEWHYLLAWIGVQSTATPELRRWAMSGSTGLYGIDSAAYNLAVLSAWQNEPLDTGFYYGAGIDGAWGWRDENRAFNKNYYSMILFGKIMANCTDKAECEKISPSVYPLAALDGDGRRARLLVADYRGVTRTLEIGIEGMADAKNVSAVILDDANDIVPAEIIWHDQTLTLVKNDNKSAVFLVTFER